MGNKSNRKGKKKIGSNLKKRSIVQGTTKQFCWPELRFFKICPCFVDPFDSPEKSHSAAKTRKYSACSRWDAIFSSWCSIRRAEIGMFYSIMFRLGEGCGFLPKLSMGKSRKRMRTGRLNAQKAPQVQAKNERLVEMQVMENFTIHDILLTRSLKLNVLRLGMILLSVR